MVSTKLKFHSSVKSKKADSFLSVFASRIILQLKEIGKDRTSETYNTSLRSFMQYRRGHDIRLSQMDTGLMLSYENWLKAKDTRVNTRSFYMRNLRALYNRAVEAGLTAQNHPFRYVYTGNSKTAKRAVPLKIIRKIKHLDLSDSPTDEYARDLFLFSFYTRGMAFIDMAYLKKSDLQGNFIIYHRKKTGQQLCIKLEQCTQAILKRYAVKHTSYLLPIIRHEGNNDRRQYQSSARLTNRHLKSIGERLGLSIPLTMYVARHSWASAARDKKLPLQVISEGLGHDSQATTEIYLSSLNADLIDRANLLIIKDL